MMKEARYDKIENYFTEETKKHCDRVTHYVELLTKQLNILGVDQKVILAAAQIHDIGKYYIPDNILDAPRPLTRLEREVIDMHAYYGYEACKELNYGTEDVKELVLLHHGMNKYRKLKDNQIGSFAKKYYPILIAADMYDALTSDRVYRKALDRETALKIIAEHSEVYHWVFTALEKVTKTGGLSAVWKPDIIQYFSGLETLKIIPGTQNDNLPSIFNNVRGYYMNLIGTLRQMGY